MADLFDALGGGAEALRDDLISHYQPADGQPNSTDPAVLTDRLARKLTPIGNNVNFQPSDFSKVSSDDEEDDSDKQAKGPDLSKFGTPVETAPPPSSDDLSSFGTPVEPAPAPDTSLGVTGQLTAAGKGLLRGAPESVGTMLQGAASQRAAPATPDESALIDQLAGSDQMTASQRAKLMGQAIRTIGDRGKQMDFNAALQRIARGGNAQEEADKLRASSDTRNAQLKQVEDAGTAIKQGVDKAIPMTPQEQSSIGGQVGSGISGVVPYVLGGAVLGPTAALAAGAVGMGLQSGGSAFEAAKAKGATDEQAAKAAGWGAAIGATIGVVPLGAVFKPVAQAAPGMKAWLTAKLVQAGQSGVTFATVGEAQEYLLQEAAKAYDPKAGYSWDTKRVIANFLTGATVGMAHPLSVKPDQISSPADIAEFLRRAGSRRDLNAPEPTDTEVVPPRPGLPGPPGSVPPPEPGPKPSSPSGGEGAAATPPKTDHETLLEQGFSEQDIADMSPRARARYLEEASAASEADEAKTSDTSEIQQNQPKKGDASQEDNGALPQNGTGKRDAPIVASSVDDVLKASEVAKEPTPAQAAAENYQHGHLEIPHLGLEGNHGVSIETGVGQMRHGVGADGTPWSVRMPVAYGRIKGTKGADGEPLDVSIGPNPKSHHVFIIDQRDPATDQFDEHKIMVGFDHPAGAVVAYRDSFADSKPGQPHSDRMGAITAITADQFKDWIANGDTTKRYSQPGPKETSTSFKTAKGSSYEVHDDGTTTRNKAARSDIGHEGDSGPKDRSAKTVYLDKDAINGMAIPQDTRWRAVDHGDGTMSLATWNEKTKDWGISPGSRGLKYAEKPAVGLHPLELWKPEKVKGLDAYRGMHPGNAITEVGTGKAAAPRPITSEEPASPVEGSASSSRGGTASEGAKPNAPPVGEQEALSTKTPPKAQRSNQPLSLLQFLASKGGLRPHGDLTAMDAHLRRVQIPGRRGFFGLVRDAGMKLDEAREAAEEAGYLKGEHNKTSTERDLLDAVDNELRGQKKMAEGEEHYQTPRERTQDTESSDAARQKEVDHHLSTIEADADYRHVDGATKQAAAEVMADEGMSLDDAIERASMRLADELAPTEFAETYGKEARHEIQPKPASEDGGNAPSKGQGRNRSGQEEEDGRAVSHLADHSEAGSERAEVTAEHHQAIEDVLGPMADKVLPVDVARAAEILAEKPDIPPGLAFQHAVIENAVDQGFLTVPEVEKAYGPEVKDVLDTGSEGASGGSAHPEQGSAEPRQERAGGGKEGRQLQSGGPSGAPASNQDDQGEVDNEPNAGRSNADTGRPERADAGSEAVPSAEQSETADDQGRTATRLMEDALDKIEEAVEANDHDAVLAAGRAARKVLAQTPQAIKDTDPDYWKQFDGTIRKMVRPSYVTGKQQAMAETEHWWRSELTHFGRKQATDAAGMSEKVAKIAWHYLSPDQQHKLMNVHSAPPGHALHVTNEEPQTTIPGTEPISQGEQAQRQADQPLKPTAVQQPADDGLFGDGHKQTDLLDLARRGDSNGQDDARNGRHARTSGVGLNEDAVQEPEAREVLRGRHDLPGVDGQLRGVLPGHGTEADATALDREDGERQGLPSGQLRVGDENAAGSQSSGIRGAADVSGQDATRRGMGSGIGDQAQDAVSAHSDRLARGKGAGNASAVGGDGGISSRIPGRDAGPESADVSPSQEGRGVDAVRDAESERGASDVSGADQGRAESSGRPADDTGAAGSGGAGPGSDVRVPDRLAEPVGGREESPVRRNPAASVKGENYTIEPGSLGEDRGPKAKAIHNVDAIALADKIIGEGRPATAAEQAQLACYVGWGGIKGAFQGADGEYGKGFEDVGSRLKELLTPDEYDTARRSIQYAHYTAEDVIRSMWKAAEHLGFDGGLVFEPGMGVGHFAGMMPPDVAAKSAYTGVEMDHVTARIAGLLYPQWGVRREDFTKMPLAENAFDLAIGNPPFADVAIHSDPKYAKHGFLLHDYFFAKSLDAVRPGGLLMFVTSAGTMNKIDPSAREYMAERAVFVGGVRLPGNAFKKNAGTEVTTDILILRKLMPGEQSNDWRWTQTAQVSLPGPDGRPMQGPMSAYFADNPEMVLGKQDFADKLYEGRYSVKAWDNFDLKDALAVAVAKLPRNVMVASETPEQRAELDFEHAEKKSGTYYLKGATLMQMQGGAGQPVAKRGKGVEGGKTAEQIERIRGLVPIRDALRETYAADLADDKKAGDRARKKLNAAYDTFVGKFGPINKAEIQLRRPSVVQQESARAQAREEARQIGDHFDEGEFSGNADKSLAEIARERKAAREAALAAGKKFDEGSFDPEEMPDIILDKRVNIEPFMDDPESYRLRAIEHYDDASQKATKGLVFTQNVITREKPPEIKSINDAALYVLNQKGRLDLEAIGAMVGKSKSDAIEALGSRIYRVPGTRDTWETKEAYLSGNVRKKLAIAKKEAQRDPALRRNVEALEAAQPAPLAPAQISANLGMPWIPPEIIVQFAKDDLGLTAFRAEYITILAQWNVSGDTDSLAATTTWGTSRRNATALISDALNHMSPKIYDELADGNRSLNVAATQQAQDKLAEIKDRFRRWVFADDARADPLAAMYNEKYNNLVVREFDGSYLTTPGISSDWNWRPHQKRAIARIIEEGNTYIAHSVGAGKTSVYIGAAMEMRRLGLVKKPMIAVPNHMLGQFTKEFYAQYPTARLAVADERNFHADKRKQFMANVALDDLDCVIITHTNFGMIPVSDEFNDEMVQTELDKYRAALAEMPRGQDSRITRSRIEKQIERLEQRLTGKSNKRRDNVFTFDEMGVDFVFVDEAHEFRKLDFTTQMSNLKGITPDGSSRAWDLYVKTKLLEKRNPGRNLVLGSGTPVTNTMAELYTVSRYLQPNELAERGLSAFDAWAGAFGEEESKLEQDVAGGYKAVSRFAKFVNVAELSAMVRQVMDVVNSKQLEQYVVRPRLKGGNRIMNLAEKSPEILRYQDELAARMVAIKNRGRPQPGDDIMLSIIGDGRHAAIDMRLAGGAKNSTTPSKLDLLVDNVFDIWKRTKAQRFYKERNGAYDMSAPVDVGPATQMIFANLGLSGKRGLAVPDYIRAELVRRGVPRDQIAYIADYKTSVAKQKLFNDMNIGKVRVLIGSSAKMGTGVNAQRRLYANHNLDPLWYPADDEQRNGRILRQGNLNPEIEIHDYSTKGTYDSTMWGLMERKARFIQGFFEGDPSMRDMEDLGEASQYAQAMAMTTNDPRLMQLTELKADLERAERRKSAFESERYALKRRQAHARDDIDHYGARAGAIKQDIALRTDISGDNFAGKVGKETFTKRAEFGEAIFKVLDKITTEANAGRHMPVGEISSFPIVAHVRKMSDKEVGADLLLRRAGNSETTIHGTSALGLSQSMQGILAGFDGDLAHAQQKLAAAEKFLRESQGKEKEAFKGNPEIEALYSEVQALEAELSKKDEEKPPEEGETALASLTPDHLTPKAQAKRPELERMLTAAIHKMIPSVRVEFSDQLLPAGGDTVARHGEARKGATTAVGMYFPARHLIRISMTPTDPTSTAFHEAYHAIEHLLQTAREQELMLKETPRLRRYVQESQQWTPEQAASAAGSEIRAIAFEVYRFQRAAAGKKQGIHLGVKRWYHRLADLTRKVKHGLDGLGFQTADDIFAKAFEGGFADRTPRLLGTPFPEDMLASMGSARNPFNAPLRDSLGEDMDKLLASPKERFIEGYQNLSRPVQKLEEHIEARLGGELPDSQSFYQKKRLFPGKVAAEAADFNRDLLDPLVDLLKQHGIDREEAGDILYALHAPERNREMDKINMDSLFGKPDMVLGRGSGMSNATAAQILARHSPDVVRQIDQHATAIRRFINGMMVSAGLESQATIDNWNATYDHYVPLSGWEDAPEDAPPNYRPGGSFTVRGPEVRSALGRKSKADNPLVNLFDQAYRTIERAKKNDYLQALDKAMHELEESDLRNFARFDRGLPKKQLDKRTGLVKTVESSGYRNDPGAVAFKRGGNTHYIILENKQLADSIKRMGADVLHPVIMSLIKFQNKLKATWTHYSPEFLLRHFLFRYPIEGAMNSFEQKEAGDFSVGRYISDATPFLGNASKAIFATNKGETHSDPKIAELQRYWEEMRDAGGAIMFRQMRDTSLVREHLESRLNTLYNSKWASAKAKWQAAVEAMDTVTNALDNALRLAAYAGARKQGKTPEQAAMIAREATVDFQQSGRWKNIMSLFAPFSGVAINTGARMTSAVSRSRIMRRVFGASIAVGFLSGMFNYLIGGNDHDGIPFADKMAWWEKSLTFTLINPFDRDSKGRPQPIHIPMPYNWAFPLMIGQAAAAIAFGKSGHHIKDALAATLKSGMEALTPFGAEHNLVAQITPELARPLVHAYTNEAWNGIPIHKDPAFQRAPRSESGRKTTGDGWKYIAQGLNRMSGGDAKHAGGLDVFPEDLREVMGYYTGTDTASRFVRNTITTAKSPIDSVVNDASHVPFARIVRGTDYDAADRSAKFERKREQKQPWLR